MLAASTVTAIVLMMDKAGRNNPEHSHLHTRRSQNLKSHNILVHYSNSEK
jgi:hypothetical protein